MVSMTKKRIVVDNTNGCSKNTRRRRIENERYNEVLRTFKLETVNDWCERKEWLVGRDRDSEHAALGMVSCYFDEHENRRDLGIEEIESVKIEEEGVWDDWVAKWNARELRTRKVHIFEHLRTPCGAATAVRTIDE